MKPYNNSRNTNKDYVTFTDRYTGEVYTDMGSWLKVKSTMLGIAMDIVNNLPLNAYNYEGKVHTPLTLNSIFFIPKRMNQAVDIVMEQIELHLGFPVNSSKSDVIVHNKKELAKAVMSRKSNIINVVIPKNNPTIKEMKDFYEDLQSYLDVITRYLYIQCRKKYSKIIKVIYE